jgi:hypothetical protein
MPGARIPVEVDDLTPEWFSEVLQRDITRVDVVDRHSGTTGRVRLTLFDAADLPGHVFVKLPPFDAEQRAFVNAVGMGVTEARFYRDLAGEVGLRVPESLYAEFSSEDGYVMVLEDLKASGCRFPAQDDVDIEFRTRDIVEQLAGFHAGTGRATASRRMATWRGSRPSRPDRAMVGRPSCAWPSTATPTGFPTSSDRSPSCTSSGRATSSRCTGKGRARSSTVTRTSATSSSTGRARDFSTGR